MVLESIITLRDVEKRPELIIITAMLSVSVAILIATFAFNASTSMLWIAFTTIAMMPLMVRMFQVMEKREVTEKPDTMNFVERNVEIVRIYAFFFFGVIFATSVWFAILPPEVSNIVFAEQVTTVSGIKALGESMTGQFTGTALIPGDLVHNATFIFTNNMWVLGLVLLTSVIYGAGAIFVITWNASVIGVYIGRIMNELTVNFYQGQQYGKLLAFGHGWFITLGFLPHGLLELTAYTFGAIAGSLISAAIVQRKYRIKEFEIVFRDGVILLVLAAFLLGVGALVEAAAI